MTSDVQIPGTAEGLAPIRHAVDVLMQVRERLETAGAHAELLRLSRMSSDELRILVDREIQYPEGVS